MTESKPTRYSYCDPIEDKTLRIVREEITEMVGRLLGGQRTLGGFCKEKVVKIADRLVLLLDHNIYELRYVHVWGHSLVGLTHKGTGLRLYLNTGLPPEGLGDDYYLLTHDSQHQLATDPMKMESIPLRTIDDVTNAAVLSLHEAHLNTRYYPARHKAQSPMQ